MKDGLTRIQIIVKGEVQGVFFRHSTKEKAEKLGIIGYVRNLPTGAVEIIAEGEKEKLEELVHWASAGPAAAKVTSCETQWNVGTGEFSGFTIR